MNRGQYRAAIIGCGDVAAVHFAALEAFDQVDLAAVCDVDNAALERASAQYGVPGYADVTDLLAHEELDVVHVTTPHHQHADPVVTALAAGVHVLAEKPLAHNLADADRIIEAARNSQAKLGICFQNRYNVAAQTAHSLLRSGELGEVRGAAATVMWSRTEDYYRAKPWRGRWDQAGGGVLINQAIHTLDLLQWLVGDVERVEGHASGRFLREVSEVEDTAELVMHHAGGQRSVVFASLGHAVADPVMIEIVTDKAVLRIEGDLTIRYSDGRSEVIQERRITTTGRDYWGVSHETLIRDFYAQLESDEPFWISAEEARKSLKILTDVYELSPQLARN